VASRRRTGPVGADGRGWPQTPVDPLVPGRPCGRSQVGARNLVRTILRQAEEQDAAVAT
jgi:hypothetical protein